MTEQFSTEPTATRAQAFARTLRASCGALVVLATVGLGACHSGGQEDYQQLSGGALGTYFKVTYKRSGSCQGATVADVERWLALVNASMSTWQPDTELMRLNGTADRVWFTPSEPLWRVLTAARAISEASAGAFDPTVGPLVQAWGFGSNGSDDKEEPPPAADELARIQSYTGVDLLDFDDTAKRLRKYDARVSLDLSAIAKGFAVDEVSVALQKSGCVDHMVDVGGEVRVAGDSPRGGVWNIGVEVPVSGTLGHSGVQRVLMLRNKAVATSGDYRNFRVVDGRRLSHTIDPRTARPVDHGLASVSVVHDRAMHADGWATALMVLGPVEGPRVARAAGVAALFVYRAHGASGGKPGQEESFLEAYTPAMSPYLAEPL